MRKTSVYLTDQDAEGLRRLAATVGKTQAELMREGLRRLISEVESGPRTFGSLGRGYGGGKPYRRLPSQELYRKAMGER